MIQLTENGSCCLEDQDLQLMTTDQSIEQSSRWQLRHLLASVTKEQAQGAPASPAWLRLIAKNLRILITVAILSWFAWHTDWERMAHAFEHLRLELWLTALVLCLITQVIGGYRWKLLAAPLGFHGSTWQFTSYSFVGAYFNLLLPTSVGGDVVRAWFLDHGKGRRMASFISVLIDRATGLMVLLLLACVAVLLSPNTLEWWVSATVWGMAAAAVLGLASFPFLVRKSAQWSRFRRLAEGARFYLQHPRLLLGTAGLSLAIQGANVILVWLIGMAIGLSSVPPLYYWIFVPMVSLFTLLPISVNGMGIREGGTAIFLAPLGVDNSTAVCLAVLWFAVLTATSLCGGLVYFFRWFPPSSADRELKSIPDQIETTIT
jgi:uncharacterized membrane protein YbhN (UPF0104 family)